MENMSYNEPITPMAYVQCRHLIPALNALAARAKYTTARLVATPFPRHVCMDDLTTKRTFDSQAMQVILFELFFVDMLSMGVCKTRHWQTSVRLVQELNVCTVVWWIIATTMGPGGPNWEVALHLLSAWQNLYEIWPPNSLQRYKTFENF